MQKACAEENDGVSKRKWWSVMSDCAEENVDTVQKPCGNQCSWCRRKKTILKKLIETRKMKV